MIVVMRKGATQEQVMHMVQRVEQLGLKSHVIVGTERTVIAAIGDKRDEYRSSLERGPGVAEVVPILAPYKVASLEVKPERTVIRVGPLVVGNAAHRRDRRALRGGERGADHRHRPGRQGGRGHGLARRGLQTADQPLQLPRAQGGRAEILAAAREVTGLPVVTEVMAGSDVPLVARYADVLQIGARNMQNYRLLEAAGAAGKPVLLKRGPSATIDELLLAAEYILNAGNQNVMLCERGIRTFETHTRYTLPLATRPLPAREDPSAGGRRSQPRHGPRQSGAADGRRRRGRRGRRPDAGSPSRPRKRHERRLPDAQFPAVRRNHGPLPPRGRGGGQGDGTWGVARQATDAVTREGEKRGEEETRGQHWDSRPCAIASLNSLCSGLR